MSGWGNTPGTSGGTFTGAISLADIAATLTGGGTTATWTPTALSYTFTCAQASGSTGISWDFQNAYTSGQFFRLRDNTSVSARTLIDFASNGSQLAAANFYSSNALVFGIGTYTSGHGVIGAAVAGIPSTINVTAGASTNSGGGAVAITAGAATSGTGGAITLLSGAGGAAGNDGGAITQTTGAGATAGTGGRGGNYAIVTGNGNGTSARQSGSYSVTTGTPSSTGISGGLTFQTGAGGSVSGASGGISITTGATTSGTTGSITLAVGTPTAGTTGDFGVTGARNFTLTGSGVPVMTIINDDAGASGGPDINLYRNSASAAANDVMGRLIFEGNSTTPTKRTMGTMQSVLVTATDGAEDAKIEFLTIAGGAENLAVWFAQTGQIHADLGAGTGNVTVFDDYDDVKLIRSMYDIDRERRERALESLSEIGLVSRKRGGSGWAMAIQPWLALLAGGIYQTADRVANLEAENRMLKARVQALEAA